MPVEDRTWEIAVSAALRVTHECRMCVRACVCDVCVCVHLSLSAFLKAHSPLERALERQAVSVMPCRVPDPVAHRACGPRPVCRVRRVSYTVFCKVFSYYSFRSFFDEDHGFGGLPEARAPKAHLIRTDQTCHTTPGHPL
jgi:hypothetical protein